MRQLLFLILLIFAGRWLVKSIRVADAARAKGATGSANGGAQPRQARSLPEPIVRCASCGVHAPKSESLFVAGQYFCCAEHARRHAARAAGQR
ncbi:MAG: uncharacterized protein QOI13_1005 [Paraburkholderia sp.]|jgi:uncharacterized protein|nr:uncharacterized protein [Paraburkholderia sp.]MEA3121673.1 uncharacterized protein [Paraburkholderia sp.]